MKIYNSKNISIIETDELDSIYKSYSSYSKTFDVNFHNKRYSNNFTWSFKTQEERDKVFDIIKLKLSVVDINDTDLLI